jgi:hypothetical protein
MKRISTIFFLLILFASTMAVTANYLDDLAVNYNIPTHFKADVQASSDFTISAPSSKVLSGTPGDLSSGSVVCPNTQISLNPIITASTYKVQSIFSPYPPTTAPPSCTSGAATRPIKWLSESTFNSVRSNFVTNKDELSHPSDINPLGGTSSFFDECMTLFDGATQYNSASARARIFGKGTIIFKDGTATVGNPVPIDNPSSRFRTLTTLGNHQISSTLTGVDTLPVINTKTSDPYFRLYSFSYNAPSLGSTVSKTIKVENRQNAMSVVSTNPSSPTITVGKPLYVAVNIQNTGNAIVQVNSVQGSPSSPITVAPLNVNNCGTSIPSWYPPCIAGENGFNRPINPGIIGIVFIQLDAPPATAPGTYSLPLTFTHTAVGQVCNAKTTTTQYQPNIDIIDPDPDPGSKDTCQITDGPMPVETGSSRIFQIQCAHQGDPLGPCTGASVQWDVTPSGFGAINSFDNTQANITFPVPGAGSLDADVTGTYNATCRFPASGMIRVQDVSNCSISPNPATMYQSQARDFTLECFDSANNPVTCPSSVNWAVTGFSATQYRIFSQSSTGAQVGVHASVGSKGQLNATIGDISCISDLTVNQSESTLDIKPDSVSLKHNDNQTFTATCTLNNNPVPCSGMAWDLFGIQGTLSNTSDTGALYTATVDNITDDLWAMATGVPGAPYDNSIITVGSGDGPNGCKVNCGGGGGGKSEHCTIYQPEVIFAGMAQQFSVGCGVTGLDPCSRISWIINGIPNQFLMSYNILVTPSPGSNTLNVFVDYEDHDCKLDYTAELSPCVLYS